ncbi:MAG: M48 family metallopeptidase [Vicinamibacterales bacterium]
MSGRTTQPTLPFDDQQDAAHARSSRTASPRRADSPRQFVEPSIRPAPIAFVLVRSPRARRYVLRLRPDGVVRVTIPVRGSKREALDVIERHRQWIERQWRQRMVERSATGIWHDGTPILFRGDEVPLRVSASEAGLRIRFADQTVAAREQQHIRPAVEQHLRELAARELEPRLRTLAARHDLAVSGVTIRDQRTRWGSCSHAGRISLNWRLVQMPAFVSDYILLHELMHLRQANHSRRFWREVEAVCPGYREAETWLRRRGRSLWQ